MQSEHNGSSSSQFYSNKISWREGGLFFCHKPGILFFFKNKYLLARSQAAEREVTLNRDKRRRCPSNQRYLKDVIKLIVHYFVFYSITFFFFWNMERLEVD